MTTPTNEGLMLGKFCPMHQGHKFGIMEAAMRCHQLTVLLCIDHIHDPKYPTPEQRLKVLEDELKGFDNIKVETVDCTAFPYAQSDSMEVSKYWAEYLFERYPSLGTIFGSEKYVEYMCEQWPKRPGAQPCVIDLTRRNIPISATAVRTRTSENFGYLVEAAKPLYTKHVLVIGSESVGKTTLVRNLGEILKAPTVPEMYRSMFPAKGMDFTPDDLIRVARAQNQAVKCQVASPLNKGIVIHDTCNDVTWLYGKIYYPNDHVTEMGICAERNRNEVKFDLILFCDADIPWEDDGTRCLGGTKDRKAARDKFYSLAAEKANRCGCPMVVLNADYKRIPDALAAIEEHVL